MSSTVFLTAFFLMATLIVAIGAQNAFVLRQGLLRQHVGLVVLTCTVLDVLLTTAGVSGIAALLTDRPALLRAIGLAGAAALAAYAVAAARRALAPAALQVAGDAPAQPRRAVLAQMLALTLLNPHVYLDTVLLAGSVGARQPAGTQGAFIAGAGAASALWFFGLGYGARWLRPLFARPLAWRVLDALIALTMAALSASLLHDALG
jgi:L-lysine exporter family protein LysE/ArgO